MNILDMNPKITITIEHDDRRVGTSYSFNVTDEDAADYHLMILDYLIEDMLCMEDVSKAHYVYEQEQI